MNYYVVDKENGVGDSDAYLYDAWWTESTLNLGEGGVRGGATEEVN